MLLQPLARLGPAGPLGRTSHRAGGNKKERTRRGPLSNRSVSCKPELTQQIYADGLADATLCAGGPAQESSVREGCGGVRDAQPNCGIRVDRRGKSAEPIKFDRSR